MEEDLGGRDNYVATTVPVVPASQETVQHRPSAEKYTDQSGFVATMSGLRQEVQAFEAQDKPSAIAHCPPLRKRPVLIA